MGVWRYTYRDSNGMSSKKVLRKRSGVSTSDDTQTVAQTITLPEHCAGVLKAWITGKDLDSSDAYGGVAEWVVKSNANVAGILDNEAMSFAQKYNAGLSGLAFECVASGPTLQIKVTGLAGKDIEWDVHTDLYINVIPSS